MPRLRYTTTGKLKRYHQHELTKGKYHLVTSSPVTTYFIPLPRQISILLGKILTISANSKSNPLSLAKLKTQLNLVYFTAFSWIFFQIPRKTIKLFFCSKRHFMIDVFYFLMNVHFSTYLKNVDKNLYYCLLQFKLKIAHKKVATHYILTLFGFFFFFTCRLFYEGWLSIMTISDMN